VSTTILRELQASVAAIRLGVSIYRAKCQFYGLPYQPFSSLPLHERDSYIKAAQIVLKAAEPSDLFQAFTTFTKSYATGLRGTHGKIIGFIQAKGE
jgi:hypothetical protein